MDPLSLVGAGISVLGNLFGGSQRDSATRDANAANIAAQERINAQNIALSRENNAAVIADKARDRELQQIFAQQGIRWKADDARAAGIHPLYAMGANTVSYAASPIGLTTPSLGAATVQPEGSMGTALAQSGQDISRAINSTRTQNERAAAVVATSQGLQLENMGLQNELLRAQIAKINTGLNPPMPSISDAYKLEGQTSSGVKVKDVEIEKSGPDGSHAAGAVADTHYSRSPTGWPVVPSKDVKERIEDMVIPELLWSIRNNLGPILSNQHFKPPPVPLKQGYHWSFNPILQEYQQVPSRFQERWEGRR